MDNASLEDHRPTIIDLLCLTVYLQSNRVTLKMDVSHTEHSHVIGKGGNNIKRVMMETGCHIHFPDSNRGNNVQEKSNQVSEMHTVVSVGGEFRTGELQVFRQAAEGGFLLLFCIQLNTLYI